MVKNYLGASLLGLLLLLLFKLNPVSLEACRTMCYNDKSPRCKVVIEKDSIKEIRGIYQVNRL